MTKGGATASASNLNFTDWGKGKWEAYRAEDEYYAGACLPSRFGAFHQRSRTRCKSCKARISTHSCMSRTPDSPRSPPMAALPARCGNGPDLVRHLARQWEGDTLVIDTVGFNLAKLASIPSGIRTARR